MATSPESLQTNPGLPGFDSFVTMEEANAYWTAMGDASWSAAPTINRAAALRRATQYIVGKQLKTIAVFPAVYANIKAATNEAAIRALTGKLYEDVTPGAVTSVTVGPISETYAAPGNGGQTRFGVIDALLRGLTVSDFRGLYLERS